MIDVVHVARRAPVLGRIQSLERAPPIVGRDPSRGRLDQTLTDLPQLMGDAACRRLSVSRSAELMMRSGFRVEPQVSTSAMAAGAGAAVRRDLTRSHGGASRPAGAGVRLAHRSRRACVGSAGSFPAVDDASQSSLHRAPAESPEDRLLEADRALADARTVPS